MIEGQIDKWIAAALIHPHFESQGPVPPRDTYHPYMAGLWVCLAFMPGRRAWICSVSCGKASSRTKMLPRRKWPRGAASEGHYVLCAVFHRMRETKTIVATDDDMPPIEMTPYIAGWEFNATRGSIRREGGKR